MMQAVLISRSTPRTTPDEHLGDLERTGGVYYRHMKWVEEMYGAAGLAAVRAVLPTKLRERTILPSSRLKFADIITLDRAIEAAFGAKHPDILAALGRHSADLLSKSPSARLNAMGIHEFFTHSARISQGEMTYAELSSTSGRITHCRGTVYSPVHCATMRGYYEGHILVHAGADPHVKEASCVCQGANECVFDLRWKNV